MDSDRSGGWARLLDEMRRERNAALREVERLRAVEARARAACTDGDGGWVDAAVYILGDA
jgi:hypothetical protein